MKSNEERVKSILKKASDYKMKKRREGTSVRLRFEKLMQIGRQPKKKLKQPLKRMTTENVSGY